MHTLDAKALVARVRAVNSLPSPQRRKLIREDAGVSQRDLAAALDVHVMTLNRWERGVRRPRPEHAVAYASLLAQLEEVVR